MHYKVMASYQAGSLGPWTPGQIVELEPQQAEWVNRDSPGTLEQVRAEPKEPVWKPALDRMVRKSQSRGVGGPQEPITKATFKAVKRKGD